MEHTTPPFFKRGPSPLTRLSFFALLSLVMMTGDARFEYLEVIRQGVAAVIYPLQRMAAAPIDAISRVGEFFVTQSSLLSENARLRQQHLAGSVELQRFQALVAENAHLRKLLEFKDRFPGSATPAEILYAERNPFSRKLVIDKGRQDGVRAGQVVVDDVGVVGQVTRAYPFLADVTLITDKDHAVPVQSARTGLRTILFGAGEDGALEVRYLAESADIQNGDLLVTSGIDGTYPPGLPVATVSRIERDSGQPFARVLCTPSAGVDRSRHLMVLTAPEKFPEKPEEPAPGKQPRAKPKRSTR